MACTQKPLYAKKDLWSGLWPGFCNRWAKTHKGGRLSIQYWMHAATSEPNMKGGAQISNGGLGTTGPPAGDGPELKVVDCCPGVQALTVRCYIISYIVIGRADKGKQSQLCFKIPKNTVHSFPNKPTRPKKT